MKHKAGFLRWGSICVTVMLVVGCASPLTMAGRYPKSSGAFGVIVNDWIKDGDFVKSVIAQLREKGFYVRLARVPQGAPHLPFGVKGYLATYSQRLEDKTHLPLMLDRHAVWYVWFKVEDGRVCDVVGKYESSGLLDL